MLTRETKRYTIQTRPLVEEKEGSPYKHLHIVHRCHHLKVLHAGEMTNRPIIKVEANNGDDMLG